MTDEPIRFGLRICDHYLDYCVQTLPADGEPSGYQVDVALRGVECPMPGSNLQLQLFDENFAELRLVPSVFDHGPLFMVAWPGQLSAIKSVVFQPVEGVGVPAYLAATLAGQQALLPVLLAADGAWPLGLPDGTAPPAEDEGPAEEEVSPRCCPVTLEGPDGLLDAFERRDKGIHYYGSGGWKIEAVFKDDGGCDCLCCEYRQYLKGTAILDLPYVGGVRHVYIGPVVDYDVIDKADPFLQSVGEHVRIPGGVRLVRRIDPDDFKVHTVGNLERPGDPWVIGSRKDPVPASLREPGVKESYERCRYRGEFGTHQEGFGGVRGTVRIDIQYRGAIVDTCRLGAESMGGPEWQWKFTTELND